MSCDDCISVVWVADLNCAGFDNKDIDILVTSLENNFSVGEFLGYRARKQQRHFLVRQLGKGGGIRYCLHFQHPRCEELIDPILRGGSCSKEYLQMSTVGVL